MIDKRRSTTVFRGSLAATVLLGPAVALTWTCWSPRSATVRPPPTP
ncbi:hypothetical protein [Micromonospora sp. KC207]|nr:hypothetical protein [Micromonospora sp. KC207]